MHTLMNNVQNDCRRPLQQSTTRKQVKCHCRWTSQTSTVILNIICQCALSSLTKMSAAFYYYPESYTKTYIYLYIYSHSQKGCPDENTTIKSCDSLCFQFLCAELRVDTSAITFNSHNAVYFCISN